QRILRTRPHISFLENVEKVTAGGEDEDGLPRDSDATHVKKTFEDQGFSCIDLVVSARDYGSATERKRWFCVVFDIAPSNKAEITNNFFEILNSIKIGAGKPEDFLIDNNTLAGLLKPGDDDSLNRSAAPQAKASKGDPNWKLIHEEAFSTYDVQWPPELSEDLLTFRYRRESEVAFFGNALFPCSTPGRWEFFDVNRTLERTFKYPPKQKRGQLTNPWKEWVPCMTGHSCFVGRIMDANGDTMMKRIHGLEAMQLMGWDLSFYKDGVAPFWQERVTPDVLVDLAGNARSAFSVAPLFVASMGRAPWVYYKTAPPPSKRSEHSEIVNADSDDSSDSD
ncbi:unnamed protein product, partial [Prorocentrum cordatum]